MVSESALFGQESKNLGDSLGNPKTSNRGQSSPGPVGSGSVMDGQVQGIQEQCWAPRDRSRGRQQVPRRPGNEAPVGPSAREATERCNYRQGLYTQGPIWEGSEAHPLPRVETAPFPLIQFHVTRLP